MEKEQTRGLRFALIGLVAVIAFAMAMLLSGCSSDDDKIKEAIDAELGTLVEADDDAIAKLVEEADVASNQLDSIGIDETEMVKSWIDGFAYEIGDISVDGDSATAKVSITSKQLMVVMEGWAESIESRVSDANLKTTNDIYAFIGQSLMDDLNSAEVATTEVTFELEKSGGDWTMPDNSANQQALLDAMFGGGVTAADLEDL